jgi:adenylate kinase family enzyme
MRGTISAAASDTDAAERPRASGRLRKPMNETARGSGRSRMERVVVIGTSCCGKTTLARRVAEAIGSPHIELDAIHWGPDWTEMPTREFRATVQRRVEGRRWVVDGNYSKVQDIVWSRATDAIWLNYSFSVVFGRALLRTFRRVFLRERLFSGNRESFRTAFLSRDSILWWVLKTFRRRRRQYRAQFGGDTFPQLRLTELRRPREAERLVSALHNADGLARRA